jgi:hypothetical protein
MALPFLFHPKPFAKFEGQLVIVISEFQAKIQRFQLQISRLFQKSHQNDLTKLSISIPYRQQNSSSGDSVV